MPTDGPAADRRLVERCIAGDQDAWNELYDQVRPKLLVAIRIELGPLAPNNDLVEEIASLVWYSLLDGQSYRLERFDPARHCRLTTYVAALARREILRYRRAEARRQARELLAARHLVDGHNASPRQIEAVMEDFLATLSPRERLFCESHLLKSSRRGCALSRTNAWQLRHRVRRKLALFMSSS